jgi:hypothetical protein
MMTSLVSPTLRARYSAARVEQPAPQRPPLPAGRGHINNHIKKRRAKPEPKSSPTTTPTTQSKWFEQNPQFEIIVEGRNYAERGVLSPNATYYGGEYPVLSHGYVRVGVRQLSKREKATARQRKRLARINQDPELKKALLDRANQLQRERRARIAAAPELKEQRAQQRRELWRAAMADPKRRAQERQRSRERARVRRERREAAKTSVRDTGAVALSSARV